MTIDRDFRFIFKTYELLSERNKDVVEVFAGALETTWLKAQQAGLLSSGELFLKFGDVDFHADSTGVRDWPLASIALLPQDVNPALLDEFEEASSLNETRLSDFGVKQLSHEHLIRRVQSGTAIPNMRYALQERPPNFSTAIEYMKIPDAKRNHYRDFMRRTFGPVGIWLLRNGASFTIYITEVERVLHRDPSLPDWNEIHVLTGDFSSQNGFVSRSSDAVKAVVDPSIDVHAALSEIDGYRKKVRMSDNKVALSIS